jgi:hypothetical protein
MERGLKLTTVRVPTISRGGSMLLATSWLTKCAVIPTMETMATILRPREIRKVLASGAEEAIFARNLFFGCVVNFVVVVGGCFCL